MNIPYRRFLRSSRCS